MWIYGAGGFGRETLDACEASAVRVAGFLDDGLAGGVVAGVDVTDAGGAPRGEVVVAIADPATRSHLHEKLVESGWTPTTVVDARAVIGARTRFGPGSVVLASAHVSCDVRFGVAAHVNYGATIGHDTRGGACVTVLPGANVGGNVELGDRSLVGAGAVILQGLEVGADAVVGAGSVVTRSVPPGVTVVGVPARQL